MQNSLNKMNVKELEFPETVFIRDIEGKVFQSIVLRCLAELEGVEPLEGTLFDSLLGDSLGGIKGIHVDQDQKNHSVNVRVEVNVAYGVSLPKKAEEIQNAILESLTDLTGLHVGAVHVIFKNLISAKSKNHGKEVVEKRIKSSEEASDSSEVYSEII